MGHFHCPPRGVGPRGRGRAFGLCIEGSASAELPLPVGLETSPYVSAPPSSASTWLLLDLLPKGTNRRVIMTFRLPRMLTAFYQLLT